MIYKYLYKIEQWPDSDYIETSMKATKWCKEQFGLPNKGRWALYANAFGFVNKEDYVYFLLRWAC